MQEDKVLKGLQGWLVLIGLGIIVTPLRIAHTLATSYYPVFTDGTFNFLTTPGTELYHPLWGPLLIAELIYNSAIVMVYIYLIYLFFSKHYLFPKVFITVTLVAVVFIPLDVWVGTFIPDSGPAFDPETKKEFLRALFVVLVWVPYMLVSKRVEATFVGHMPNKE
ncbi:MULTISPECIES: DUF2569 domain-containing protein [Pseudomonas]|uniref:DUF2569 domain-containing protein n=1 Tax=Pseudomonas segetis TaxID=298908 RepID=A0A239DFV3_9PSED|nr:MULTISPECIES: DUF2569 domain-containing protein [Pseudomonas]SNS30708.1 Protein of unknown function [Pseudomonas segetis]